MENIKLICTIWYTDRGGMRQSRRNWEEFFLRDWERASATSKARAGKREWGNRRTILVLRNNVRPIFLWYFHVLKCRFEIQICHFKIFSIWQRRWLLLHMCRVVPRVDMAPCEVWIATADGVFPGSEGDHIQTSNSQMWTLLTVKDERRNSNVPRAKTCGWYRGLTVL